MNTRQNQDLIPSPPPKAVVDFFSAYDTYHIIGHSEPDGDCVGSQLALADLLKRRGKQVHLYSPGPFSRPEMEGLASYFLSRLDRNTITDASAAVVLDCSTPDRIGELKNDIEGLPLCVIDHHASGTPFGTARWVDPRCAAVTIMIFSLIQHLGDAPSPESARDLFFGLATDTGFFRHLDETGGHALKTAAGLADYGASPKKAFARMYGNSPFESRILLGRLLERVRSYAGGKLLYTFETLDDRKELGPKARDSDTLYQLLFGTQGCEAAVVIREESETECSAGLRSLHSLDVGAVANEFGGGGHTKAAGFSYTGTLQELESRLLPLLTRALE